jgi:hypothetical protein
MSFLNKLRLAQIFGGNDMMPGPGAQTLFGDLIPRRVERPVVRTVAVNDEVANSSNKRVMNNVPRVRGIDRIGAAPPENKPMNVVYDPGPEQFDKRLRLERDRLDFEKQDKTFDNMTARGQLDVNRGELGVKRDQLDVNVRKQALDEWESRNPEGQIEQGEDGILYVIDKRTGAKKSTGLKGADLTEAERVRRNIAGRLDVVDKTKAANLELEKERQKGRFQGISPSQQRVAEDDAAAELLRDQRYAWMADKGYITVGDNGVVIKRPTGGGGMFGAATVKEIEDSNKVIDQFEKDWKIKASERMNRGRGNVVANESDSVIQNPDSDIVEMVDPSGRPLFVPRGEVADLERKGAKVK